MPHMVFFDDQPELSWPQDLEFAWKALGLTAEFGPCTTELINDRHHLAPVLRRKRLAPDVLFVDLNWGESDHDGLTLIQQARQLTKRLPIIALTGVSLRSAFISECLQAGADRYWHKGDSDLSGLAQTVAEVLRNTRPLLDHAAALRQIRNKGERARLTLEWIEQDGTLLPPAILREALGWIVQGIDNHTLTERRGPPLALLLQGVTRCVAELKGHGSDARSENMLMADALYDLGQLSSAEQIYAEVASKQPEPWIWERLASVARLNQDEDAEKHYLIEAAEAFEKVGQSQRSLDIYNQLVNRWTSDRQIQTLRLQAARSAGKPITPFISVALSAAAAFDPKPEYLLQVVEQIQSFSIATEEVLQALKELLQTEAWTRHFILYWSESLYLGEEIDLARRVALILDMEDLDNWQELLRLAELYIGLNDFNACQRALDYTAAAAKGTPSETLALVRCQEYSLKIGDSVGAGNYFRQQLTLLSEAGLVVELKKLSDSWNCTHQSDLRTREHTADILLQHPDYRHAAFEIYDQLLSFPAIRTDTTCVRRVLRKILSITLPELRCRAMEIHDTIQKDLNRIGVELELRSEEKPLKGERIVVLGCTRTGEYRNSIDGLLQRNGARTKWKLYASKGGMSPVNSSEVGMMLQDSTFCIFHQCGHHSVDYALMPVLKSSGISYELLSPRHGMSEIIARIEAHFGPLVR